MRFFRHIIPVGLGMLFMLSAAPAQAQGPLPYENGPVHEAYMTPSTEGGVILQSIAHAPPAPINEIPPPQCHNEAIWIPGYWAWIQEIENFVWVSGVWRKAPPGHLWIPGYWNQFSVGWAWVRGFWSEAPEHALNYIADRPHEPREELIPVSPGRNYFWMPGYWEYNYAARDYNWLSGQWVLLDPNWVYVPAYYLWRPEGFLFIPGYWDMPLETRGCAYSAVLIDPAQRGTIVYVPSIILEVEAIIRWCFIYYPDHTIFFWHYRHFYPAFWQGWCCTPPWWGWDDCWCFNWHDNWGLWWWWTHPGFPHPHWMTLNLSMGLPPPPQMLLGWMMGAMPPAIITPWGVVSPWALMDAIGGNMPIMPANPRDMGIIFDKLKPDTPPGKPLLPTGKPGQTHPLPRPETGLREPPGGSHVTPPPIPTTPPPPLAPPTSYPPPAPIRPPQYVPEPRPPVYTPPPSYYPPPRRPQPRPWRRPKPWRRPPQQHYPRPPQDEYPGEGYPGRRQGGGYPGGRQGGSSRHGGDDGGSESFPGYPGGSQGNDRGDDQGGRRDGGSHRSGGHGERRGH